MGWDELLWHIEHRLGMYVGQSRYERAFSLVTGFDLARGRGELKAFEDWMSAHHSKTNVAFWWLIVKEAFGASATPQSMVSDDDHQLAIAHLCFRLREFLALSSNQQPSHH